MALVLKKSTILVYKHKVGGKVNKQTHFLVGIDLFLAQQHFRRKVLILMSHDM